MITGVTYEERLRSSIAVLEHELEVIERAPGGGNHISEAIFRVLVEVNRPTTVSSERTRKAFQDWLARTPLGEQTLFMAFVAGTQCLPDKN